MPLRDHLHGVNRVILPALLAVLANLVLLSSLPLWVQSVGALLLSSFLPATLLLDLWLGPASRQPQLLAERLLYIVGTGYGISVSVMLGLSYLPGALPRWLAFATFDTLFILLVFITLFWHPAPNIGAALPRPRPAARPWLWIGLLSLALVGGFLRFPSLGYAEFQGDEARAMLRAAEVLDGFDDSLFQHRKGPTEILLPAVPYALSGRIDEAAARLPFAFANFCALFALFLLGWRWFGALGGWVAAMFLALDGYLIAFSRIVQYQSIIFLTVVLVLLILQRLALAAQAASQHASDAPENQAALPRGELTRYLTLAAFLLALGLLSHYEAILVVVPAIFLLWRIWRNGVGLGRLLGALLLPLLVGGALLAAFYVPFVRFPTFGNTFEYLAYKRIGEEFAYNNLADYFIRSTLYSSTYAFALMTLLALFGLTMRYQRGLGKAGQVVGLLVVVGLGLTFFWSPSWLTVAGQDYTWSFFVGALVLAFFMPDRAEDERVIWLWFGAVMVLSIFFTATPNTHVYNFYFGWALACGLTVETLWASVQQTKTRPTLRWLATPVAAALILVFGFYQYSLFIRNDVEVLRTWSENRPPGYWTAYDMPIDSSIFGFPHRNGWKTVSVLYRQGVLSGGFETNSKDWIVDWYTRGLGSCALYQRYYVLADKVEPTEAPALAKLQAELEVEYELLGVVKVQTQERLRIYTQKPPADAVDLPQVQYYDSDMQGAIFDRTLSAPQLAQSGRVANPLYARPLNFRLGDELLLIGYTLHNQQVAPGGQVELTLYWHAQQRPKARYTVFTQLIGLENAYKIGQRDGEPVCGNAPTVDWRPGDVIADHYYIPVARDAPYGIYGVLIGMYKTDGGGNLTFYNSEGKALGDSLSIDQLEVAPPTGQQTDIAGATP